MTVPAEPLLNFVHVPKTAGTTFLSILRNNYPADRTYAIDGMDPGSSLGSLEKLDTGERARLVLLMGHWSILGERFFPGRRITRIVFLRNPVSHFLSMYHFIRGNPRHLQYGDARRMDMREFLVFRKGMNLDNIQTRNLAGIATNMVASPIDFSVEGDRWLERAAGEIDASRYVFVTEEFDAALRILRHDGLLRDIGYRELMVSVGKARVEVAPDLREAILAGNRFDATLYERARAKYLDNLAAYPPEVRRRPGWAARLREALRIRGG